MSSFTANILLIDLSCPPVFLFSSARHCT